MAINILNKRTGATLLSVQAASLAGQQWGGHNLSDADLRNQDLREVDFSGANISGALFSGAKTGRLGTAGANQEGSDFTGQDSAVSGIYVLRKAYYEVYSGSRAAMTIYRDASVSSRSVGGGDYKQTVTLYRRIQARIVVCTRLLSAPDVWTVTETQQTCLDDNLGDNHHSLSHVVDGLGYYHLFGPWLDNGFKYWRGATPDDVNVSATWATTPIVSGEDALEYNPVYPQAVVHPTYLGNDVLYSYWQVGGGPSAYPNKGIIWRRITAATGAHTTLTPNGLIKSGFCPYKTQAIFDSSGKLWMAGCYRDDATISSNHDLWCMWSDPADGAIGTVWRSAKTGNIITQPVQPTDTDNAVVVTVGTGTGMMNSFGLAMPGDLPAIAYWGGDPANYYLGNKRATGGAWVHRQVGTLGVNYTLVGKTDNASIGILGLTQPRCLHTASGDFWILFAMPGGQPGIWGYRITPTELDSTASLADKLPTLLCPYDVGGGAVTFDELLFRETGQLHVYVQRCSADDSTDLGGMLPCFIAEITLPGADLVPTAIASAQAFGTTRVNITLPMTGIDSGETFGATLVSGGGGSGDPALSDAISGGPVSLGALSGAYEG